MHYLLLVKVSVHISLLFDEFLFVSIIVRVSHLRLFFLLVFEVVIIKVIVIIVDVIVILIFNDVVVFIFMQV